MEWKPSRRLSSARLATGSAAGRVVGLVTICWLSLVCPWAEGKLEVGFAVADITPELRPDAAVWMAGYYPGRAARGVHDPLYARCVVLRDGPTKLAWVSVDLIGLQLPAVDRVRAQLTDYRYVLISSTHNHEGPDVIGPWGRTYLHRGVDDQYVERVIAQAAQCVRRAEQNLHEARASYGTAADSSLLADRRLPVVKDDVLRLLRFSDPSDGRTLGIVLQWNCHPEALGPDNQLITADFPAATIAALGQRYDCPVVYMTGAIGGLLAPPTDCLRDERSELLREGDFAFARGYGEAVAALACRAADSAQPIRLTPFQVSAARIGIPMTNELYRWARVLGVLRRDSYAWNGEGKPLGEPLRVHRAEVTPAILTEVGAVRLGDLTVAALPGELFPELVTGPVEDPAQPGADYPDSPIEPTVVEIMPDDKWMLFGLANDEIGYILPRRQWDRVPPFAYGLTTPQYGEINSCGADVGPVIMRALQDCVRQLK